MAPSHKALFLDIDGVANKKDNFNPANKPTLYPIDRYCAFLIGKIQLDTDCIVVLSSSWRHHPDSIAAVEKEIVKIFDKTPEVEHNPSLHVLARGSEWSSPLRGDEINAWLKLHPEITRYAILDDDSDFYDDQPLFQTSFETGLTPEIALLVTNHLNS